MKNQEMNIENKMQNQIENVLIAITNKLDFNSKAGETITEDLIFDICCDVAFDSGLYEETNDNWYNEIYVPTLEEVKLSNLKK